MCIQNAHQTINHWYKEIGDNPRVRLVVGAVGIARAQQRERAWRLYFGVWARPVRQEERVHAHARRGVSNIVHGTLF